VFEEIWAAALAVYDDAVGIDWTWQSVDGCMTKAPLGGKTVAAEVASVCLAERQPACFEIGQIGNAVEVEAAHLGLALLVGAERSPLALPCGGRHLGQLPLQVSGRCLPRRNGIHGEPADADDERIGALVAGNPALATLDPPIELL